MKRGYLVIRHNHEYYLAFNDGDEISTLAQFIDGENSEFQEWAAAALTAFDGFCTGDDLVLAHRDDISAAIAMFPCDADLIEALPDTYAQKMRLRAAIANKNTEGCTDD